MRRNEHAMPKRERGPEFHRVRDESFVTVSGFLASQPAAVCSQPSGCGSVWFLAPHVGDATGYTGCT